MFKSTRESTETENKENEKGFSGVVENVPETGTGNIDLEIETNSVDSSGSRFRESKSAEVGQDTSESSERQEANLSFKERLKLRFQKFRETNPIFSSSTRKPTGSAVRPSTITEKPNQVEKPDEKDEKKRFGSRKNYIREHIRSVLSASASPKPVTSILERTFIPSRSSSFSNLADHVGNGPESKEEPKNRFSFKKFDRFNRPEIRRNHLNNIFSKEKDKKTGNEETNENTDETQDDEKNEEEEENIPILVLKPYKETTSIEDTTGQEDSEEDVTENMEDNLELTEDYSSPGLLVSEEKEEDFSSEDEQFQRLITTLGLTGLNGPLDSLQIATIRYLSYYDDILKVPSRIHNFLKRTVKVKE
ncbi:transcription initiation factor TFIID subunit 11 [Eurytemora carolleeae]|uniref:transcription initiation factor TFIID subunit 11 n=1 Tax=Eurytemora carolleeae TaxID=1294199 RepID=UPI000C78C215|nr:transcription initiation factor TFIID subunit 11 [Eurytemora carolleeae]|eukprot:XP_023345508.1 transcription initiation factor TFIID subunit 11-like [Eurytemora affinis]